MKRLLPLLVLIAMALGTSSTFARHVGAAGANDPLAFQLIYGIDGHHVVSPVDYLTWCGDCNGVDYHTGMPWVVNPGTTWPYFLTPGPVPGEPGCMWDADDRYKYTNSGNVLVAGASVSVIECLYASPTGYPSRNHDIYVLSASPNLIVTMKAEWSRIVIATVLPTYDSSLHSWVYLGCYKAPQPLGDTPVTIPDSNGGQAVPQLVTISVANPTSHKIGNTGGVIAFGQPYGDHCSGWIQL